MNLAEAAIQATAIQATAIIPAMASCCERISIAGSVRHLKPDNIRRCERSKCTRTYSMTQTIFGLAARPAFGRAATVILLLLAGCVKYDHATDPDRNANAPSFNFRILRMEGCEYLAWRLNGEEAITHKGNCTNSIHWLRSLER